MRLVIYPWPRNYEELDEAIRHAARTATGQSIAVEHLPLAIRSYRPGQNPSLSKSPNVPLDQAVQRYELRLIHEAIEAAGGNRAEAARQLGISRARLLRKIDEESKPHPKTEYTAAATDMIEMTADPGLIRPWIVCEDLPSMADRGPPVRSGADAATADARHPFHRAVKVPHTAGRCVNRSDLVGSPA